LLSSLQPFAKKTNDTAATETTTKEPANFLNT